jgi:N-acetylmuramoyl-L-alanine amidase
MSTKLILSIIALTFIAASCGGGHKTTRPIPPTPPPSSPQLPQPAPAQPEPNIHISVVYPVSGSPKPAVDSNFIFGSVGNGNALLTINDQAVPLYRNGAFLAFLPVPADGIYRLHAERDDMMDSAIVSYRIPVASAEDKSALRPHRDVYSSPKMGRIVRGSDTLQTGSDAAPIAPTPDGARKWMLPNGATVTIVEHTGKYYKLKLEEDAAAWIADSNVELGQRPVTAPPDSNTAIETGTLVPSTAYVDATFPSEFSPFLIEANANTIKVTVYQNMIGRINAQSFATPDPYVRSVGSELSPGARSTFTLQLAKPVWGYKAFYTSTGALVIRVRRPPKLDPEDALRGLRIMIDPGHPPIGATGPTWLSEKEANLNIALRVKDLLLDRGVVVLMTHTDLHGLKSDDDQTEELRARAQLAVDQNVDLMVSIHNNAFPDGVNPFLNYGTNTYYYQPFSASLAGALDQEIAPVTGIPNGGAHAKSLAICRPTWMPTALTESLFMMFPDQEEALKNPAFLERLAEAHVRGIEDFIRGALQ